MTGTKILKDNERNLRESLKFDSVNKHHLTRSDEVVLLRKDIVSSTQTITGRAELDSLTSEAEWQIFRDIIVGNETIRQWPLTLGKEDSSYKFIWDDRDDLFGAFPFSNSFSVLFDGANDFVDVGNPVNLQITGAMSISLWTKFPVNQNTILVSKGGGSGSRGYNIQTDSGSISPTFNFSIAQDSTTTIDSGNSAELALSTWHHIVGVYKPSTAIQIYVNGSLASENTTAIPATQFSSGLDFVIGSRSGPSSHYDGNIDEVAIWNRDLLSSEITTLFGTGVPGDVVTQVPSNLISFWRMGDNDIFPAIKDNQGTNDGVMTNMAIDDIVLDVPE